MLITALLVITAATAAVYAEGDAEWYQNNAYLLSSNSIVKSAFRLVGWWITEGLCWLCSATGKLYDVTFSFLDVTKYGRINSIITQLRPVLAAAIAISVVFLGLSMMIERERKPKLLRNIILSLVVVTCSLYAFNLLNSMAVAFKDGMIKEEPGKNAYEIVDSNMIDLVKIARKKKSDIVSFNYADDGLGKGMTGASAKIEDEKALAQIDINETLNYSNKSEGMDLYGWSEKFNELISEKMIVVDGQKYKTRSIYDGVLGTGIGNEFYYRYIFSYVTCWMELMAYLIMIIALSYKNIRIMYELVVARILAYMHAADITSGERLKQILYFIRDTYIVLGISILSVKLYLVLTRYLTATVDASYFHGIGGGLMKGIISLFISFCVIDGPNIAERLLGMDAGLQRSIARTWGAFEIARGLGRAATRRIGKGSSSGSSNEGGHTRPASAVEEVAPEPSKGIGRETADKMNMASAEKAKTQAEAGTAVAAAKTAGAEAAIKPGADETVMPEAVAMTEAEGAGAGPNATAALEAAARTEAGTAVAAAKTAGAEAAIKPGADETAASEAAARTEAGTAEAAVKTDNRKDAVAGSEFSAPDAAGASGSDQQTDRNYTDTYRASEGSTDSSADSRQQIGGGSGALSFMEGSRSQTAETAGATRNDAPVPNNMHVDFMEKGATSGRHTSETVPERQIETNSNFTYRMPDKRADTMNNQSAERKIYRDQVNSAGGRDPSRIMNDKLDKKDNDNSR